MRGQLARGRPRRGCEGPRVVLFSGRCVGLGGFGRSRFGDRGMEPDAVVRRYRELQAYVGWTDADAERVAALAGRLAPHFPALVEDFYAEIERHDEARRVIRGGPDQIERLKGTLRAWLAELLSGRYDEAYVERRWRV